MSASFRAAVLNEAKGYITQDRNTSYGEPEDNFSNIAAIWNAQGVSVGGKPVSAVDVALMMVGMKLARLKNNPTHRDSYVDAAGYIACGAEIALDVDAKQPQPDSESVADMVLRLTEPEATKGVGMWVSNDRCTPDNPYPHMAHSYSRASSGAVLRAGTDYWCDGYVVEPVKPRETDLDVIKRVADKHAPSKLIGPVRAHMDGPCTDACFTPVEPRPIVDAPQA